MAEIVEISDFKGFFDLSVSCVDEPHFQKLIDRFEKKYLTQLMGIEFRDLFIADLVAGVPVNAQYLSIYNEFYNQSCSLTNYSCGLKDCLLGLIYYEIVRIGNIEHSLTGLVYNSNENSDIVSNINTERYAEIRYNESVGAFNSISYKMQELSLSEVRGLLEYKFLDIV